jgi:hypothetical protein
VHAERTPNQDNSSAVSKLVERSLETETIAALYPSWLSGAETSGVESIIYHLIPLSFRKSKTFLTFENVMKTNIKKSIISMHSKPSVNTNKVILPNK